jgi:hypothetical protein
MTSAPDTTTPHPCLPASTRVAAAAAEWWAEHLRGAPKPFDNGEAASSAQINALLDASPRSREAPPEEAIARFVESFIRRTIAQIYRHPPRNVQPLVYVQLDYHPSGILADALQESGLADHPRAMRLPVKTGMEVGVLHASVSGGYRHPYVMLADERPHAYKVVDAMHAVARHTARLADHDTFGSMLADPEPDHRARVVSDLEAARVELKRLEDFQLAGAATPG